MDRRIPNGKGLAISGRLRRARGFTIVELMVVMAIIVVLISMAIPMYQKTVLRTKESVLRSNLFTLRTQLSKYAYDQEKAPRDLQDLVSAGYLHEVPYDPITGSNQTWRKIMEDPAQAVNQSEPGIADVRSGSEKISLEGTPYADWK